MRAQFERESLLEGPWTGYNASLGRPLLDSRKFLEGEKAAAKSEAEDSVTEPASPQFPPSSASSAPLLDLLSEQKT